MEISFHDAKADSIASAAVSVAPGQYLTFTGELDEGGSAKLTFNQLGERPRIVNETVVTGEEQGEIRIEPGDYRLDVTVDKAANGAIHIEFSEPTAANWTDMSQKQEKK